MKNVLKFGLVGIVVVVATLFLVSTITYAQGPRGGGPGGMMGWGGPQNSLIAVAANTLGMPQADLVSALQGGKTIADVAKDKGVALDKIVEAFVAPRQDMMKTAVASGRFTQAQADNMITFMKAHILAQLSQPFTARGPRFSDSNNDGLCDNCGMMNGQGRGMGQNGPHWGR